MVTGVGRGDPDFSLRLGTGPLLSPRSISRRAPFGEPAGPCGVYGGETHRDRRRPRDLRKTQRSYEKRSILQNHHRPSLRHGKAVDRPTGCTGTTAASRFRRPLDHATMVFGVRAAPAAKVTDAARSRPGNSAMILASAFTIALLAKVIVLRLKALYRNGRLYFYRLLASTGRAFPKGFCNICGNVTFFFWRNGVTFENSMECGTCGGAARYRLIARVLASLIDGREPERERLSLAGLPSNKAITILDTSYKSRLYPCLKAKFGLSSSEFLPELQPGRTAWGITHQDLKNLTFPDSSFDYVITSEVFEHIDQPWKAFQEIYRVLKSNGAHIFTIPFNEHEQTKVRAVVEDGTVRHLAPAQFHRDPLSLRGSLVFTDFGLDLMERLEKIGFETTVLKVSNEQCGFSETTVFVSKKPSARECRNS